MKIKSCILLCLIPVIIYAEDPLPSPSSKQLTTDHEVRLKWVSSPGPLEVKLGIEITHKIESQTLDKVTNMLERTSNVYSQTPSLFATLGIVAIGCASFYCGWKLLQGDKPQKPLGYILIACGFLAACAPFVLRTISV